VLKTLKRTGKLESDPVNEWKCRVLREVEGYQKKIVNEMIDIILSEVYQLLGRSYTRGFTVIIRRSTPSYLQGLLKVPTVVASRIVKSFRERKRKGLTRKDKPEYKSVMITIPNMINWRFNRVFISVLTHKGWVEIPLRVTKQFILHEGWRVSQELKLRLVGESPSLVNI